MCLTPFCRLHPVVWAPPRHTPIRGPPPHPPWPVRVATVWVVSTRALGEAGRRAKSASVVCAGGGAVFQARDAVRVLRLMDLAFFCGPCRVVGPSSRCAMSSGSYGLTGLTAFCGPCRVVGPSSRRAMSSGSYGLMGLTPFCRLRRV